MNNFSIIKKVSVGFATLAAGLIMSVAPARASQCSIPYQGVNTPASPVPAFNVFCGPIPAPAPTDGEGDFLQARVPANGNPNDPNTPFTDPVSTACTNGELLQLHIYIHNGASADGNNNGTGPSVMHGAKVAVTIPSAQQKSFVPTATLSANNATAVSDTVNINCSNNQAATMQYVPGSASQYSLGSGVSQLSDSIVNGGAPIHSEQVPGDLWACWQERVYVVLSVKLSVPTPPPPVQATAACNLFTVLAQSDRTVKVNQFQFTENNASFRNVVINWGDSNNTTVTNSSQVIGQTHQFASTGDYEISALVTFDATNGATPPVITSGGPGTICSEKVTFSPSGPPVVTPPSTTVTTTSSSTPPSQLVNTGPGSVAAIFAGAAALGTAAYRWILGRRLSQQ